MIKQFFSGLFATAALTLSGCAAQDTSPIATASASNPAKAAPAALTLNRADADPALWKIADADTTIYIFGTMHALKKDLVWFDDEVSAAFDASDELVIEMVSPDSATAQGIMAASAMRTDGTALSSQLTAEQQASLASAAQFLGVPVATFEPMQPWFAAMTMSAIALNKLGYGADTGAEAVLQAAAKKRKVPVSGLETFEQQMGFFSGLDSDDQVEFLMAGVEDIENIEQMFAELERAWGTGDVEATAKLMQEGMDESPALFEVLLAGRNRAWAAWIDERMDSPGTVFLAVGAGHLSGKGSVQEYLAQRNISAMRVEY